MLAGPPYDASDPELLSARAAAREVTALYNATGPHETERRTTLLARLLGRAGAGVFIEPPFFCDYGFNIELGEAVYLNTGCVVLDCSTVVIGAGSQLGPAVQLLAATHPTDPDERLSGRELAFPISIGRNCWIGGGAIVGPGVSVGDETTIGAGSVVVRDIPARSVAVGNPCRVTRSLAED